MGAVKWLTTLATVAAIFAVSVAVFRVDPYAWVGTAVASLLSYVVGCRVGYRTAKAEGC
jgi:hypothetical protein